MLLLQICGKMLERLLYNEMFDFFITNHFISANQLGFKTGDSCINQLISITSGIYVLFDKRYEVRGVFFDKSKAFDQALHEDLILN